MKTAVFHDGPSLDDDDDGGDDELEPPLCRPSSEFHVELLLLLLIMMMLAARSVEFCGAEWKTIDLGTVLSTLVLHGRKLLCDNLLVIKLHNQQLSPDDSEICTQRKRLRLNGNRA